MIRGTTPTRLGVVALVALVIVVAVVSAFQILYSRSTHTTDVANSELTAVQLGSTAVAGYVENELDQIKSIATIQSNGVSALAPDFAPNPPPSVRTSLKTVPSTIKEVYPALAGFALVRPDGSVAAATSASFNGARTNFSNQPFFTQALRDRMPYVSAAFLQSPGGQVFGVAVPAFKYVTSGPVIGVVLATLPVGTLARHVSTSLLGGGRLVVVDQSGHALTGPGASPTRSYLRDPAVALALAGQRSTGTYVVPGFAGSRLVGFSPVDAPDLHWALMVEIPESVVLGPVRSTTWHLGLIDAVVLAIAIAALLLVGRLLRQLQTQRDRAGAVFASVGEGIAVVDDEGIIREVNPALARLVGRPPSELVGGRWTEAIPIYGEQGDREAFEDSLVATTLRERAITSTEGYTHRIGTISGEQIPISKTVAPLTTGGEPEGAVVIVRDVSREREVDRLKSTLVSTVSHELRTPLTMIQGFSELLLTRDDIDASRSRAALEQVHTSSQRLAKLIEDLLSVSRIDAGKMIPEVAPMQVGEVIRVALSPFEAQFTRRFDVDIDDHLDLVLADRGMVVNLVTNLVSNAIKYSPSGSPVRVTARQQGETVEVAVIDEGIGLSRDECDAIFDKFTRADRPEVRRVGGTGLGLYISKQIVEAQGGRIWVTSEVGRGSTFTFSLPLAVSVGRVGDGAPGGDQEKELV